MLAVFASATSGYASEIRYIPLVLRCLTRNLVIFVNQVRFNHLQVRSYAQSCAQSNKKEESYQVRLFANICVFPHLFLYREGACLQLDIVDNIYFTHIPANFGKLGLLGQTLYHTVYNLPISKTCNND